MIKSKFWQSVVGVGLLLGCGAWVIWTWHTAMTEGYYYVKEAIAFPAFAVMGLGLLLFPLDFEKLQAEHGVSKPTRFEHYPTEWKILFFVSLAAGLINWFAISNL